VPKNISIVFDNAVLRVNSNLKVGMSYYISESLQTKETCGKLGQTEKRSAYACDRKHRFIVFIALCLRICVSQYEIYE
jgi:hypothetical protein